MDFVFNRRDKRELCYNTAMKSKLLLSCFLAVPVAAASMTLDELRHLTDQRIASIRATADLTPPPGAPVYYLSEKGDDANDGRSPATAWKTTARLDREKLDPGAYVLFERGGLFRNGFKASRGVTYAAYGKGPKPRIYASPENGADPAKWEKTDAEGIWRCQIGTADVGTLVFDDGAAHAVKILPVYNKDGTFTQQYTKLPFNNGYKDLAGDLHFWHDYSEKTDFKPFAQGSGYLYLRSERNPGERFKSIEFNVRRNAVRVNRSDDVHVDNLCIKYAGAHGVGAGTVKNLKVTNCEFGWIGGSVQAERIFNRNWAVRFGNAVEIYGGCDGFAVTNCYIYQVYDAALTQQYSLRTPDEICHQRNMLYANNVIECCNYGVEYFLSKVPEANPSRMEGFTIARNIMWRAGEGFCAQRPDHQQSAHIKSWRNHCNRAAGYAVRDNVFACGRDMLIEVSADLLNPDGTSSMPEFTGNTFFGTEGQRFGVLNQGKPAELVYDETLSAKLAESVHGRDFDVRLIFLRGDE